MLFVLLLSIDFSFTLSYKTMSIYRFNKCPKQQQKKMHQFEIRTQKKIYKQDWTHQKLWECEATKKNKYKKKIKEQHNKCKLWSDWNASDT